MIHLKLDHLIVSLCLLPSLFATTSTAAEPYAVPTFESLGVYWETSNGGSNIECSVEYRESGTSSWNDALSLWWDDRTDPDFGQEYRGSIVNLNSGTNYDIRLTLSSGTIKTFTTSTWSDNFPIAQVITVNSSSNRLVIDQGGSAQNGYVVYTAAAGQEAVIDVAGVDLSCVLIKGGVSHVILRGLTLKNAQKHGIMLGEYNSSAINDIVIEDCDISGWGQINPSRGGILGYNLDSAIYSKSTNLERIIIQGNKIHHPRTTSNSWDNGHPKGPQGITFENLQKGNHVIRYNEFYSDDTHYFNDAMGEVKNFSQQGFPNRDSDIYGNYIERCWDDGIESEGRNENVRIWGNYIDRTYVKIGIAPVSVGPTYIWNNVGNSTAKSPATTWRGGTFFKAGGEFRSSVFMGGGKTYLFHNTSLTVPSGDYGAISAAGVGDSGVRDILNHVTRNNIFKIRDSSDTCIKDHNQSATNDFDYDIYTGSISAISGSESNGANGTATYVSNWGYDVATSTGIFQLASSSLGYNDGEIIPNFNDNFAGAAPDAGAHEAGATAMVFGTAGFTVSNGGNPFAVPFTLYNNGNLIRSGGDEVVSGSSGIDPTGADEIDADASGATPEATLEAMAGFVALQGFESFGSNTSAADIIDFDSLTYPDIKFDAYGSASSNSHGIDVTTVSLNTSEGTALQLRNNSGSPRSIYLDIDFGDYNKSIDSFNANANAVGAAGFVLTELTSAINATNVDYFDPSGNLITNQNVSNHNGSHPDVYFGYNSGTTGISRILVSVSVPSGATTLSLDDLGFAPVSLPTFDYDIHNAGGIQGNLDAVGFGADAIDPSGASGINQTASGATAQATLEATSDFIGIHDFDGFGHQNNDPNIIDFIDNAQPDVSFNASGSASGNQNGITSSDNSLNTSDGTSVRFYNNSGSAKTLTQTIDFGKYNAGTSTFDGSAQTVQAAGFVLAGVTNSSINLNVQFKDSTGTVLSTQTASGGGNDNIYFGYDSGSVGISDIFISANVPSGTTSFGLDDLGFTSATATSTSPPANPDYDVYSAAGLQGTLSDLGLGIDAIDPSGSSAVNNTATGATAQTTLEAISGFVGVHSFTGFGNQNNDPNIIDFVDGTQPDISFNASGSASGNNNGIATTNSALNASDGTAVSFYNNSGSAKTLTQTIDFGEYNAGTSTFDGSAQTVQAAGFVMLNVTNGAASITVEFKDASGIVISTQTASGGTNDNIYFGYDSGSTGISEIRISANVPSGLSHFSLDDLGFAP